MRKFINIIRAEILRLIEDFKAYWINYVFSSFNSYIFFFGLFLGMRMDSEATTAVYLFIIGLLMWSFSTSAIKSVSNIVQSEIRQGTIEQLFMTDSDVSVIIFGKLIARFIFDSLLSLILLTICIITFGQTRVFSLDISVMNLIINLAVFNFALWGIGYVTAGLTLKYKKAGAVAGATTNFILFFSGVLIDINQIPQILRGIAKVFPFYWGAEAIKVSTINVNMLEGLINSNFVVMVMMSVIYLCFGYLVFRKSITDVLRAGSLAQY